MIIKLPRDQVEIFEMVEDTEAEIDVENVSATDENNVNLQSLEIKQENTSMDQIKQENLSPDQDEYAGSNEVPIKIERQSIELIDIKEEKPNIDEIVMENLNQSGAEYEAEDDEDADANWEPTRKIKAATTVNMH
uniref:Uncharacterized protein n=1 Tax=Cacopsylla melanoneura TaxID=428564 RepID=A0A8D8YXJ5_9HEMI